MNSRVKHILIQGNTWMRMWWLSPPPPLSPLHQENKNEHFVPWCRSNLIGCWWFNLACKLAARETTSARRTSFAVFLLTCWHVWCKLGIDIWDHRWLTSQSYMAHVLENKWHNSGPKKVHQLISTQSAPSGLLFMSVLQSSGEQNSNLCYLVKWYLSF